MSREANFYTLDEAAKLLGLAEYTILGLLTSGELEGQQDDQARWWIPATAVDKAAKLSEEKEAEVAGRSPSPTSEETTQLGTILPPTISPTTSSDTYGQSAGDSGWTTTEVAARALAVSPRTVRRLIDRGELEGRKIREGIVEAWEVSIDSLYTLRNKRESEGQVRRGDHRVSVEEKKPADLPPDTADYIRELTERLLRLSSEVGELRTRLELTAKAESTLQDELDRVEDELERTSEERRRHQEEAERLRAELEAERSKGFWQRLFGG